NLVKLNWPIIPMHVQVQMLHPMNTFFCGHAFGSSVLQPESTVKVKPGSHASLECHILLDGPDVIFWMKFSPNNTPVCVATAKAFAVDMCVEFARQSRIKAIRNQKTFNLSFSSVEQTDAATYFCGMFNYGHVLFGNGSKLVLEEHADMKFGKCDLTFLLLNNKQYLYLFNTYIYLCSLV
uniref:Immunoglobulin domain-containing protein n=1 Tax=Astyanax mexicanus TaxID=7994 RepID=A0A8B9HIC7_ASTMX